MKRVRFLVLIPLSLPLLLSSTGHSFPEESTSIQAEKSNQDPEQPPSTDPEQPPSTDPGQPPSSPAGPAEDPGLRLQQTIEAIEKIDQELAETQRRLKAARTPTERRRIEQRIQELKAEQEPLLQRLELLVGPLSPSVQEEAPVPLEERLKRLKRRHETILESDVERRLPRR